MGKKKLFSMDEYDEATLKSYEDGFFAGMREAHSLSDATITSLMTSINDVIRLVGDDSMLTQILWSLRQTQEEISKNYLDLVTQYKVEFGLEDDEWKDLT